MKASLRARPNSRYGCMTPRQVVFHSVKGPQSWRVQLKDSLICSNIEQDIQSPCARTLANAATFTHACADGHTHACTRHTYAQTQKSASSLALDIATTAYNTTDRLSFSVMTNADAVILQQHVFHDSSYMICRGWCLRDGQLGDSRLRNWSLRDLLQRLTGCQVVAPYWRQSGSCSPQPWLGQLPSREPSQLT